MTIVSTVFVSWKEELDVETTDKISIAAARVKIESVTRRMIKTMLKWCRPGPGYRLKKL
jgi:hypothetical protein